MKINILFFYCFRPKYAVAAIKKKLYSPNPHQAMFGLLVLESIVKNCGMCILYLFNYLSINFHFLM